MVTPAAQRPVSRPAPGHLEMVRQFVNTADQEAGTDDLDTPERLRAWLLTSMSIGGGNDTDLPAISPADHRDALALREALRVLAQCNTVDSPGDQAVRGATQVIRAFTLTVDVDDVGSVKLASHDHGVRALLATIVAEVATASAMGRWQRLKVCRSADCRWAFYDASPARVASWCSMSVCGSRSKARAYRRRKGRDGDPAPTR